VLHQYSDRLKKHVEAVLMSRIYPDAHGKGGAEVD
jgi:hypothetical protein